MTTDYLTQLRYLNGPKWYLKADIRRVSEEISTISKMAETDEASLSAYRDRQKLLAEELEEPMQVCLKGLRPKVIISRVPFSMPLCAIRGRPS